MTKAKLSKSIIRLAEILETTKESIASDLKNKNPVRWYMIEEISKSI